MCTATLENLLNRGLPASPRARELCAELEGRSLAIEVRDIVRLRVTSNGRTLGIARSAEAAEATISGGPFSLLALAAGAVQRGGAVSGGEVSRGALSISGDAELAQKFRELARLLRPDPEAELALILGEVPAHQLGRCARAVSLWSATAAGTQLRNLAEWLAHERADLVPRTEADGFLHGVDALREGVDRLEARLGALAARRGA